MKKPFEDGEVVKETFCKAREVFFTAFKNKPGILPTIKNMPLSWNTVMRRTEIMGKNLENQLQKDLHKCNFLSLQFDESTDITDIVQLCIFVWMVFPDVTS